MSCGSGRACGCDSVSFWELSAFPSAWSDRRHTAAMSALPPTAGFLQEPLPCTSFCCPAEALGDSDPALQLLSDLPLARISTPLPCPGASVALSGPSLFGVCVLVGYWVLAGKAGVRLGHFPPAGSAGTPGTAAVGHAPLGALEHFAGECRPEAPYRQPGKCSTKIKGQT